MAEEENLKSAILVQDEIAERANSTASSTISPDTPMWFIGSNMASSSSAENAAAISGGPDSLALAFFCKCISKIYNTKIQYYLVDHKLRKEAIKEAKKVLQILKKQKINCKIKC